MRLPKYNVTELSLFGTALQALVKRYAPEAGEYTQHVGAAKSPRNMDFEDWDPLGGGNYRHSPHPEE